jgi:hypothetical protein
MGLLKDKKLIKYYKTCVDSLNIELDDIKKAKRMLKYESNYYKYLKKRTCKIYEKNKDIYEVKFYLYKLKTYSRKHMTSSYGYIRLNVINEMLLSLDQIFILEDK